MKKIFCWNNGGATGWLHAIAMAEDGHVLAQHACSSEGWMRHDLGLVGDWKHDRYDAHYGPGNWELIWVDNPKEHEGAKAACALNQQFPKDAAHA